MSKIRILAVTKSTGGIAFYNKMLLSALDPELFESHTICLSENAEGYAAGLRDAGLSAETCAMDRYRINPGGDLRALRHVRRVAKDRQADILICHGSKAGFIGRAVGLLDGIPAIYRQASMPFLRRVQGKKAPYYWLLEHLAGRLGGTLVAITEHARRETRNRNVVKDRAIRVIRTGIDTDRFRPKALRHEVAAELGLDPDRPIVGWLGRFEPQKAPLDYVEALRQVAPRHPDVQFVMAGEGRLRGEVEALAAAGQLPANVKLLPWQADPARAFQAMDIYALSSLWEGLPLTLLEAMACGCAPVSTTVDGCAEAIGDDGAGILVPPSDPAAMAAALNQMLSDPDFRQSCAKAARDRVLKLFDRRRMVGEWEALLREKARPDAHALPVAPKRTLNPLADNTAQPMKICMVISSYHPVVGGAEKQLAQLARLMTDQGHHLRIITRRYPGLAPFEVINGIEVERIRCDGPKPISAARFLLGAANAIRRFGPDVIHCHSTFSPTLAGLLGRVMTGRPLLVKPMCSDEVASVCRKLGGGLRQRAMRTYVDGFAAVSREIETELREHGIAPEKILPIPNGVDTSVFAPCPNAAEDGAARAALRAELGLPKGPLVLFAGRIARQKRLPLLLEVWPEVLAACPDARLLIAGANRTTSAGHAAGNNDADSVPETLLAQPGVIRLGHVDDMPSYLRAVDVFVLPSDREGLSNALLEACATGVAVVASDVGGTEDVIESGTNGRLFEPGNGAALAQALIDLVLSPESCQRFGAAARRTMVEHYDIRLTAQRLLAAYSDLQHRPRPYGAARDTHPPTHRAKPRNMTGGHVDASQRS